MDPCRIQGSRIGTKRSNVILLVLLRRLTTLPCLMTYSLLITVVSRRALIHGFPTRHSLSRYVSPSFIRLQTSNNVTTTGFAGRRRAPGLCRGKEPWASHQVQTVVALKILGSNWSCCVDKPLRFPAWSKRAHPYYFPPDLPSRITSRKAEYVVSEDSIVLACSVGWRLDM